MCFVLDEKKKNDLFYVCSLVEYVGRKTNNKRGDIVAAMDDDCLKHHLEYADLNHCLPFERVSDELIADCGIKNGDYDTITNCKYSIPTATSIGRVYSTLIESEMGRSDAPIATVADMLAPFRKVFGSFIIDEISDFANGVYFENPSYQWESYKAGRLLQ